MRILFVMLHAGYVRNYESTLRLLAARGHHIHVAYERYRNKLGEKVQIERLARESFFITFGDLPEREENVWTNLATVVRTLQDYLRYLDPRFGNAAGLRARVERNIPPTFAAALRVAARVSRIGTAAVLRTLDRALPLSEIVQAYLREQQPDVLLVTPLVDFGSNQVDYLKSASAMGVPAALCVASWDNLTNKGLMRVVPDRVFVWNETQRQEATELHGAPPESVLVTGAQVFDHWFDSTPSRSREDFCRTVGLPSDRPFVLYLGSSFFIAPDEAQFGEKWIRRLRDCGDPLLTRTGVLIRPHPTNIQQWLAFDFAPLGDVAVWPRLGAEPFSDQFKADFFDSLYYCSAAVGVNTSAMIEAGIVGRAVCTIRAPEFAHSQDGTLHFQHLVNVNGGLLQVASSLDEHIDQLRAAMVDAQSSAARSRRFVEAFVRPYGLDVPATPVLADAITRTATVPVDRRRCTPAWSGPARLCVLPLAWAVRAGWRAQRKLRKDDGARWWVPTVRFAIAVVLAGMCVPSRIAMRMDRWRIALRERLRRLKRVWRNVRKDGQRVGRAVWSYVYVLRTRRLPKLRKRTAQALQHRRNRVVKAIGAVWRHAVRDDAQTVKHTERRPVHEGRTMLRGIAARIVSRAARLLRGLLSRRGTRDRDSLKVMLDRQGAALKSLEKHVSATQARLDKHGSALTRVLEVLGRTDKAVRKLDKNLGRIDENLEHQSSVTVQLTAATQLMARHKVEERHILGHLRRMANSSDPILVGPWTGEIGFELLYWIPFVRWVQTSCELDPGRLITMSRGGPRSWYSGLGGRYIDVLDFVSREELRGNTERFRKQALVTPLDKHLIRRVTETLGTTHVKFLHPSLMFRLFTPVWRRDESVSLVEAFTRYEGITAGELPAIRGLPEDYIAVKWYFSTSFPDTPENRRFAASTVQALSQRAPVVLLKTGLDLDDHLEYECGPSDRVRTIEPDITATNNLELQTALIARARAFAGTYGGFSYLAPLLGVDTVAYFSNHIGFRSCHLELAQRVFSKLQRGAFLPVNTRDVALMDLVAQDRHRTGLLDVQA